MAQIIAFIHLKKVFTNAIYCGIITKVKKSFKRGTEMPGRCLYIIYVFHIFVVRNVRNLINPILLLYLLNLVINMINLSGVIK